MNKTRLVKLAKEYVNFDHKFKHVSIITDKRVIEIYAIGTNRVKTHPLCLRYGYKYPFLHSELDALSKIPRWVDTTNTYLFNFRFNNRRELRLAKPCKTCLPWCIMTFKEIYYSTNKGEIIKYVK